MAVLNGYGVEQWERGAARVHLAVLKLAGGNLGSLRSHVRTAKQDFRDVLARAEYREYHKTGMFRVKDLSDDERRRIIESDWKQYEAWLRA